MYLVAWQYSILAAHPVKRQRAHFVSAANKIRQRRTLQCELESARTCRRKLTRLTGRTMHGAGCP